jgi:hypothetical protein
VAFSPALVDHVRRLRTSPEAAARDQRITDMRLVRANKFEILNPDVFSEAWPKSIASNFIAQAAMDMAESLAPLPALTCASGAMTSSVAKTRASLRTKIGHHYWDESSLKKHSVNGADWYFSYGFLPVIVEPCFESNLPKIRFEDPFMSYPQIDRYGRVGCYAKVLKLRARQLMEMYPELAGQIGNGKYGQDRADVELEVIRYMDRDCTVMYCNDDTQSGWGPFLLSQVDNPLGRCPVEVAARPTIDGQFRGQYDDAIWPQIARAKMLSLALEAGVKAVESPIAVPQDLVELPIGSDAIWRTESPEKIRRVSLEIPQSTWQMEQRLEQEQMRATRYPEARSGNIQASVITGRGVDALMGSFDMLIKSAQDQIGEALSGATSLAFEMDEKVFGDISKEIIGVSAGAPYKLTYKAKDAIAGDYSCEVTYGLMAGLAPNNATVLALQLLGAGLISKESVQKQLPFDVDPVQMGQAITLERTRDAVLEGIAALAQSIPAAAQAGQDPMMIVNQIVLFANAVSKGHDVEDAALAAFTPQAAPKGQPLEGDAALQAAAGGGMPPGLGPDGLMTGVAPGQAGMPPGGMPDVANMIASFRGGRAEMGASVQTRRAIP